MQKHQNCCRIAIASEILYNCIKTVIELKLHLQLHWRYISLSNYRIKYTKHSQSTYLPSMWLLKPHHSANSDCFNRTCKLSFTSECVKKVCNYLKGILILESNMSTQLYKCSC